MITPMRAPRAAALGIIAAVSFAIAWPAFGGDAVTDLETGLRELEGLVRELHRVRAGAAADVERARSTAARVEAERLDLDREAAAIEEETAGLRESVARLESDRRDLETRRARALATKAGIPHALGAELRAAREAAAAATACASDADSVRIGPRRVKRDDEPGRTIAAQLERESTPALVRVRWSLEGMERP
jgi:hypothetical protein